MRVTVKNYDDVIQLLVDLGILEDNNISETELLFFLNELFKHILVSQNKA